MQIKHNSTSYPNPPRQGPPSPGPSGLPKLWASVRSMLLTLNSVRGPGLCPIVPVHAGFVKGRARSSGAPMELGRAGWTQRPRQYLSMGLWRTSVPRAGGADHTPGHSCWGSPGSARASPGNHNLFLVTVNSCGPFSSFLVCRPKAFKTFLSKCSAVLLPRKSPLWQLNLKITTIHCVAITEAIPVFRVYSVKMMFVLCVPHTLKIASVEMAKDICTYLTL